MKKQLIGLINMQNSNIQQKQKHTIRNLIIGIIAVIVLLFLVSFIREIVNIRGQIMSGEYNFEEYGGLTSGQGGANVDTQGAYNVSTTDDPSIGSVNAKVTIVGFGDFECPFCRQSFLVIRSLVSEFDSVVQYIYRDFPLESIHANARNAAYAGYCAEQQDKFWPMHDKMFQNQENLSNSDILGYANQVGLNIGEFTTCLSSQAAQNEGDQDIADGVQAGVLGTPTWFINGNRFAGVIPEQVFREIITDIINSQ